MLRSYRDSTILSSLQPIMPCLYAVLVKWLHLASRESVRGRTLNGIWSFLRSCLQASRFPLKKGPPLQAKCFRAPCCLGLNSGWSVSLNVNKTKKHFPRNIHGARMFPQCFPVSHAGNIAFSVSVSKFEIILFLCVTGWTRFPALGAHCTSQCLVPVFTGPVLPLTKSYCFSIGQEQS